MTGKKIAVFVLVGLVLALAIGIISALDVSAGPVMMPAVKNASVSPPVGNYTDSFNYSVEVRFYEEALIELQIHHPIEDKFKPYGERKYTGSRGWQILWWNGTIFGPEWKGKDVKYLFSWKGEELLFGEGPHIREELTWEFRNESVEPAYGYYNTPFTYSVEVKSNKEEEIHLEIFNMSSSKWEEPEEPKNYTENGTWHPLIWPNISNIASKDCKGGHSSFRFFFIESKDKHESDTIDYPIIYPTDEEIFKNATEEIFKNATVDPHAGYYDTTFTYSVEANTSGDVYLLIYDISIDKWQKEINGTNTSDNRREWKNISFSTACEGLVSYKFVAGTHESGIFYGPTLKIKSTSGGGGGGGGGSSYKPYMLYENANVEPNDWTIKGAIESKTFYYSVEVDKNDMLILEIYNPSSNEWVEKGKGNESNLKGEWGKWRHEWNVTLTLDKNWAGYGKYRFYPERWEKYASQVYYGPEIKMLSLSEWKEEIGFSDEPLGEPVIICTVDPTEEKWFKKFRYTANITHPDKANMTVVLFVYKPGSDEWKPVPWREDLFNPILNPSDYDETTNTTQVIWTVEKKDIFDEKDAGESSMFSKFYIWYWDGWNEADCKKLESEGYEGPEVLVQPKLLVNREPEYTGSSEITPDPGSTHCVYEYKFGINDTDDEIVSGLLTVVDPLNKAYTVEGIYELGNLTFVVRPRLNIFTDKKLQKYRDTSLFIWDKVPGEDSEKLKRYIVSDLGIDWARNATLTKSSDNLTISISTDNNSAEITMDEDMGSATLGIDGAQNYTLRVEKGFCWGDVPGVGNKRLTRFLQEEFDSDWAENATITKSTDNMSISIRKDESLATIRLDAKNEKAILEIGEGEYYELTVREEVRREEKVLTIYKMENSKLYLYPESFTSRYRLRYWDEGMWVNGTTKKNPEKKDSWWFGPLVRLVNVTFEEPKVTPDNGTYADDFLYKVYLESSRENTIWLTLTIYDPANPEHTHQTLPEKEIKILAANEKSLASWDSEEIQPYLSKIFGPNDFGKTARYEIAWEDQYGNRGIKKGTGPSIERAVPLLSFDQLPFWTFVFFPLLIFVGLLLVGLSRLYLPMFGEKREKGEKGKK